MRVCVYVCMCVYVYYIQYICMCMYICICVWVCVCACACVYVYVHVNVHVYVYVHEARAMSTVHACTMMVCHNTLSVHAIAIARPTCMNVFPIIANTCSTAFWPALSRIQHSHSLSITYLLNLTHQALDVWLMCWPLQ